MSSQLVTAQITAKQRLQRLAAGAVTTAWRALPHYNRDQVSAFLGAILPIAAAANEQSVLLTEAYLARALDRPPVGLDATQIVAGIRNGAAPTEVYTRPFITVWGALGRGVPWDQAVQLGEQRASSAAIMDVQLSFTHTLAATLDTPYADGILGYQRVPDDGACDFCLAATGQLYHTGELMPLHNGCGCGVEPVTRSDASAPAGSTFPAAGDVEVAVHDHGELGPLLTNATDSFTGPGAIAGH